MARAREREPELPTTRLLIAPDCTRVHSIALDRSSPFGIIGAVGNVRGGEYFVILQCIFEDFHGSAKCAEANVYLLSLIVNLYCSIVHVHTRSINCPHFFVV